MIAAPMPGNEQSRLENLYQYHILDTLPEEDYDNITKLASTICNTPISLVTLIDDDRQWFKSAHGVEGITETDRDVSFCAHGILNPDQAFVVGDADKDERFSDNPLVTGDTKVKFYAGIPLKDEKGFALGALCVIDNKPRKLSEEQMSSLKILAKQVVNLLRLHRTNMELSNNQIYLQQTNENLREFARLVAEDVLTPVQHVADLIDDNFKSQAQQNGERKEKLVTAFECANDIVEYLNSLSKYSQETYFLERTKSYFDVEEFIKKRIQPLIQSKKAILVVNSTVERINSSETVLFQILFHLVNNALLYSSTDNLRVKIDVWEDTAQYIFKVSDNGVGFSEERLAAVKKLFTSEPGFDPDNPMILGTGLSIVKKMANVMDGTIEVASEPGKGSSFTFSFSKY